MENVLLHSCCAPCSAAIVEWMLAQDIRPTLYYFNPNIFPQEEYEIRKSECSRYAQKLGLEIIDGDYDHTAWLSDVAGLEDEPERGKRCLQCFKIRLLATAKLADERGFRLFTTTPLRDGRAFNKSPKPGNGLRLALKVWNFGKRTGVKVV